MPHNLTITIVIPNQTQPKLQAIVIVIVTLASSTNDYDKTLICFEINQQIKGTAGKLERHPCSCGISQAKRETQALRNRSAERK